jgi:1-acyl-sn-glycerol-3-phosphate acyltransferase
MAQAIPDINYELIRKAVKFSAYFGYRLEIEGIQRLLDNIDELQEGAIFAGNHESVIDAFLMGLTVPPELRGKRIYFLGKKSSLWRNRFWGRMMDYFGVIPVKKSGNIEAVQRGLEVLKNRQALGIFPEGHIRYSKKALEGKVGVARFAFETDSPVIPVGIIGTDGILPYGGNWPSLGKKVTMIVGKPIFLHMYDQTDMFNPYALRAATDLIMHEIRILSKGYGIPPRDAYKLRCMEGIKQIVTPHKRLLEKKKIVKDWKKKGVEESFEDWLVNIPRIKNDDRSPNTEKPIDNFIEEAPKKDALEEFLKWLDDQL